MRNRGVVVAALIGGLLFAGWWSFGRQAPPDPEVSQTSASSAVGGESVRAQPTAVAVTVAASSDPSPAATQPSSTPSTFGLPAAEQRAVENFTARFMSAFARPSAKVSASTWWKRVAAMLTDDAVDDYLGVDPSLVPFTRVTGAAHLVPSDRDSDAAWLQEVTVPTDAGTYRVWVQLITPGLSDQLLVAEIEEP